MEQGKRKCQILKEIRKWIADENDIPYEIAECNHKGICSGTCPKCDAEIRWLESQLMKRKALGKPVTVEAQGLAEFVMPNDDEQIINAGDLSGALEPPKRQSFLSIMHLPGLFRLIFLVLFIYVLIRIALL